ncbi:sensor domain-containing diguanylate cyclase [Sulfoacidibacillus ferrooxidans]|uniref:GGDEF domain-containing protein n=1 Tax=Sulfoacidibacillus ferrooxidans TaxID=2005001 RepID=A0A9X1V965_9BACL|nr:sensor domain-containing diguanylate cyclase [Sulfoacidibacillus ferrooxidans]MCI0183467.1 hypothetical protein [Sulfoacidibacillus ferrooxidans]
MVVKKRYWASVIGVWSLAIISLISSALIFPFPAFTHFMWLLFSVLFLLLTLTYISPVLLGGQMISLSLGVEIPMFLLFGPVVTAMSLIVAWVIGELIRGKTWDVERTIKNIGMFMLMPTFASLGYGLAGGDFPDRISTSMLALLLPIVVFAVLHFISNYFVNFLHVAVEAPEDPWFLEIKWDLGSFAVEFSLALLFVFFEKIYGLQAILYLSIPFIVLLYIFRLYSNLVLANRQLTLISDLTMDLSSELREDQVVTVLLDGLAKIVRMTSCYLFCPDAEGMLIPCGVRGLSSETEEMMRKVRLQPGDGVTGTAFLHGQSLLDSGRRRVTVDRQIHGVAPVPGRSIVAVPLIYQDETLGVLTVTHTDYHAYSHRDQEMVQILASQVAISLWNARRLARTEEQSYIDQLTGVYNYRYFDSVIERMRHDADRLHASLGLLVMDLDHFKQINDRYGHLAGNEVLKSVANQIRQLVRYEDVVCRYGGEEFTVILPNVTLEVALAIAERLREGIEHHQVMITPIGKTSFMPIYITMSIGVAVYPEMANSSVDLLRNADRAMYVGSKQRGRNRVAAYEK